jgi:hypothetical protein
MNAITKMAMVALGALGIAGGAAVAQGTANTDPDPRANTANYGTPPGAPLKRDGSLSSSRLTATPATGAATTDTSSNNASTSSTDANSTSNTAAPVNGSNASLAPRPDRN